LYEKTYAAISPSQIGCAHIPKRTNTVVPRSNADLGRRAENVPSGIENSSQTTAPPITSETVIGAALRINSLTRRRLAALLRLGGTVDAPSDWWPTRFQAKRAYWTKIGSVRGGPPLGITWNRTNATSVTAQNVTIAKAIRLSAYRTMSSCYPSRSWGTVRSSRRRGGRTSRQVHCFGSLSGRKRRNRVPWRNRLRSSLS
jgi:hypothetical protein